MWRLPLSRLRSALAGLPVVLLAVAAHGGEVTVFAAASTRPALDEIATTFAETTGHSAVMAYAGSSSLARQIELGAPADVFVSANPGWMDHLASRGMIAPDTRRDLLSNRLVLIAHGADTPPFDPSAPPGLAARVGDGRLAMALVDAVPAGQYGKAALQSLGLWQDLAPRVVQTDNVRAALTLVALGEAAFGIVYDSDARSEPSVAVVHRFAPETHPPIRYPVAAVASRLRPETGAYLDFLTSDVAQEIFRRHGFAVLD